MKMLATLLACLTLALAGCTEVEVLAPVEPFAKMPTAAELSERVPVFDLTVEQAAFDYMSARYLEDIEIPARVSAYRGGSLMMDAEPGEVQIKGAYSTRFPLKPLGVKLDDDFDNLQHGVFKAPTMLPGHSLNTLRSFRLRNGGNDFDGTLMKDLAYARLVAASDLNVVPYYGEPAATFVNGEFYGLTNLRSEGNGKGISRLLGVKRSRVALAELNEGERFEVKDGDPQFFRDLEAAIERSDFAELSDRVDLSSLTDFAIAGSMFGMWDWPWKNVRIYSVDGGPVRFVLYDFDLASDLHGDAPLLANIRRVPDNWISKLFEACYADDGFRQNLYQRYDELLRSQMLHPDRLREELTALSEVYAPIIALQTERYGTPVSTATWYLDQEEILEKYAKRYAVLERAR